MKTRVTELLGIKHPVIQTGMALVSGTELVSSVVNAGGMGFLGSALPPEGFRNEIRKIREAVGGKPFGVNIVPFRPGLKRYVEIMVEEKVPVWGSGIRDPFKLTGIKKPAGVIWVPTVGAAAHAVSVAKAGADAVIVQGWEAGGHGSLIASTILIPETVERVKIPVIAAGGFSDGKGLAAVLALGAEAVAMGTRFALTAESMLPETIKKVLLDSSETDAIRDKWDGMYVRAVLGKKMRHYHGWMTHFWDLPPIYLMLSKEFKANFGDMLQTYRFLRSLRVDPAQFLAGVGVCTIAIKSGDIDKGYAPAGQIIGRINDIPTCKELIERTVAEAEQVIKAMQERLA